MLRSNINIIVSGNVFNVGLLYAVVVCLQVTKRG